MKLQSLKNKLLKLNIKFTKYAFNELNKVLAFEINGHEVEADYDEGVEKVHSYIMVTGYDESSQEKIRYITDSFNAVYNYANR